MDKAEKIVQALLADLEGRVSLSPQQKGALRRAWLGLVEAKLNETAAPPSASPLFTTHEVAQMLQVDASTIAKWIDQGKLTAFRTPGGHRRVREQDLRAFCERFQMPITGAVPAP